jgi:hypothetical protein
MLVASLVCTGVYGALQERTYGTYGPCWREGLFYTVRFVSKPVHFHVHHTHDSLNLISFFFKIITAYVFAADVRVYAEERATGFRRSEPPVESEKPRARRCHDELDSDGHPPVHDARAQLDHSTHLRIRRQSVVLSTFFFLSFFITHPSPLHTRDVSLGCLSAAVPSHEYHS